MSDQQSSADSRPDLDDKINVADAHASLGDTPAVNREKRVTENGMEPVSLGLILLSGFVMLVGGAVLGKGGGFFDYDELYLDGMVRAPDTGGPPPVILPAPALALLSKEGAKVYSKCAGCHGAGGAGGSGIPPLAGSDWVTGPTEQLSQIIYHGVTGPIEVGGVAYNGVMPAQGLGLGKKELAAVMTYIRNDWGNKASVVSLEQAAKALEIANARGDGAVTVEELKKNHDKDLEGAELLPETLIDPITFEPVEVQAAK